MEKKQRVVWLLKDTWGAIDKLASKQDRESNDMVRVLINQGLRKFENHKPGRPRLAPKEEQK